VNTIGTVRLASCNAPTSCRCQNDVRLERNQLSREFAAEIGIARAPAVIDPHIDADRPASFLQALGERRDEGCSSVSRHRGKDANAPHRRTLLRARRQRPSLGRRRRAKPSDEIAPSHLMPRSFGRNLSLSWFNG
jgi:hypothetical protein